MREFCYRAIISSVLLVLVDAAVAWGCLSQSYVFEHLMPAEKSMIKWRAAVRSDVEHGGSSTAWLGKLRDRLSFGVRITDNWKYPYAAVDLQFLDERGFRTEFDLNKYSHISFTAKCSSPNSFKIIFPTFDSKISVPGKLLTYPSPETFFFCREKPQRVQVDLTRLVIPQWWSDYFQRDPLQERWDLGKVAQISFANGSHVTHNIDISVEISDLTLEGRDNRYLFGMGAFFILSLSTYLGWFFCAYTNSLRDRLLYEFKQDLFVVDYKKVQLLCNRDRERLTIINFIAENYARSDLDLETVVSGTASNRNKINEVLRTEFGMTFSHYLNKLRLTEASRLLGVKNSASISDIAYSVGYSNVSYFNKLFKDEYGCTPKVFRATAAERIATADGVGSER